MNDTINPQNGSTEDAIERVPGPPASVVRAVTNQRRAIILAAVLVAGAFWVTVPMGKWVMSRCSPASRPSIR